jgi:hypothetical protein
MWYHINISANLTLEANSLYLELLANGAVRL